MKEIKILYVEDEAGIRENTKRPLSYMCDQLIIASDGKEGLEMYKLYNPDIVVSDIKMPNMTGIDMAKEIKKINQDQHIVFTTAHSENSFFMDAIEMQVDGYILKPIDYELLENKIHNIIKQIHLQNDYLIQQEQIKQQELEMLTQSKNAQMGEMIGNIAHQWRQPLSVISTAATGIQIKKELGYIEEEEEMKLLESINTNAQFLSQTIDTFRDYIKEEKELHEVVIQDRINIALKIIDAAIENSSITLINNANNHSPVKLTLIVGELSQVIINLINNAKDILVEKDIENKWIKVDLETTNDSVIITIEDNGGGVPLDIKDRIFDPYFTTKHKSQGTGLGLHMSKEIMEKHLNGKLYVKNSENGAKFYMELKLFD